MKKIVIFFLVLIGIVMGLFLDAGLYLIFSLSRFSPVDDAELVAYNSRPAPENNGWQALLDATNLVDMTDEESNAIVDHISGDKTMEADVIGELLARNETALDQLDSALAVGLIITPQDDPDFIYNSVEECPRFIMMSRLLLLQARVNSDEGLFSESFALINKALKFGEQLQSSGGGFVFLLIGATIRTMAAYELLHMAWRGNESVCVVNEITRSLDNVKLSPERLRESLAREYSFMKHAWGLAGKHEYEQTDKCKNCFWLQTQIFSSYYPYFANCMVQLLAERYTHLLHIADRPISEIVASRPETFKGSPAWIRYKFAEVLMIINYVEEYMSNSAVAEAQISGACLVAALKCFREKTGALPVTLDELVPVYISAVPADPLDGLPMRYNPGKEFIYSIGKDLKDAGGLHDPFILFDRSEPTFPLNEPVKTENNQKTPRPNGDSEND